MHPTDRHPPTASGIRFFQEHGYYVTPRLLSPEEIKRLRHGVEAVHCRALDAVDDAMMQRLGWSTGVRDPIRVNDYVALISPDLRWLLDKTAIAETAAALAGADQVRLFQSGIVYKEPLVAGDHSTTIGWHADRAYWRTCSSTKMLTAWIPLQDTTEMAGTLEVIDGSNTWISPEVEALRLAKTFRELDVGDQLERLRKITTEVRRVPLVLHAGQVSFHNCMTFHGSGPNRSGAPRIAVTLHLQDGDNHYVPATESGGNIACHANDALCSRDASGYPDYADPRICPVLFDRRE